MAFAETRQLDLVLNLKDQASKELSALGGKMEKMKPAFQKMAVAGTAAVAGIGIGIKKTVSDAVDLGESINAVEVVFQDGADEILKFGKSAARSVGMANAEFNQMATMTGALLADTGKPMQEVSDITIELSKRAADMASVFNTDVDLAMSAINQAIRGETEAIRAFNSDVTDASIEQFALSKGINKSVSEMTFQEKKLLRVEKIMHDTAVTAGDFENTSESLANQQRILSSELTDVSAELGNSFIPIIKDLLNKLVPVLKSIADWTKENPELTKKIILVTGAVAGLVAVIGGIGLVLPSVITGFKLLGATAGATGKGIGGLTKTMASPTGLLVALTAVAAYMVNEAVNAYKELQDEVREYNKATAESRDRLGEFQKKIDELPDGELKDKYQNMKDASDELIAKNDELINSYDGFFGILKAVGEYAEETWGKLLDLVGLKDRLGEASKGGKAGGGGGGGSFSVNDAIITPKGDIIKTDPADYLIATKKPGELAGSGGGVNINVTIPNAVLLDRNSGNVLAEVLSENLRTKLRL